MADTLATTRQSGPALSQEQSRGVWTRSAGDKLPPAIEIENLVKRYPGTQQPALAGVTFQVRAGEIFGLLGPNGAGKSTTIGILTTRIAPTSGSVRVVGLDVTRAATTIKKHIAVVPQRSTLDNSLNAYENLLFHAAYFGIPGPARRQRANELLERLGLSAWKKHKLTHFSGGMEQRLMIARALMTEPQILFLDEPTNGLDPQSRLFLWDALREVHKRGTTVVLTTHNMEEADRLCHRVGIIDHGQLLALDKPSALKEMVPGGSRLEVRVGPCAETALDAFLARLRQLPTVEQAERLEAEAASPETPVCEEGAIIRVYTSSQELGYELAEAAHTAGVALREFRISQPSLENLFIFLTGRELRA